MVSAFQKHDFSLVFVHSEPLLVVGQLHWLLLQPALVCLNLINLLPTPAFPGQLQQLFMAPCSPQDFIIDILGNL